MREAEEQKQFRLCVDDREKRVGMIAKTSNWNRPLSENAIFQLTLGVNFRS